jgi:hypothetical protein
MAKKAKTKKKLQDIYTSFTYYIPAPPGRKTGYREKEFDKIVTGILQSGFKIVHMNAQAVNSQTSSGLFINMILVTNNNATLKLDQEQDIQDKFKFKHTHSSPDIILDEDEEA